MTTPSTSTSVAVRAAEVRAYWSQVPAAINQGSIAVVEKATQSAGWISVAATTAVVATISGSVMASAGAKLATSLATGASPDTLAFAGMLGLCAGAAPAVAGWCSAMFKDGGARGLLEGAGVATAVFVGMLGGAFSGWTDGAVWLGATAGSLATLAYAAGLYQRRG
ncbi:MAG: hypothetical protein ACAI38_20385 [Myxococcota bacterium]